MGQTEQQAELVAFLGGLTVPELTYAQLYSEHLSVGAPAPERPPHVGATVAAEIRRALHADWQRRKREGFHPSRFRGLQRGGGPS